MIISLLRNITHTVRSNWVNLQIFVTIPYLSRIMYYICRRVGPLLHLVLFLSFLNMSIQTFDPTNLFLTRGYSKSAAHFWGVIFTIHRRGLTLFQLMYYQQFKVLQKHWYLDNSQIVYCSQIYQNWVHVPILILVKNVHIWY